MRQDRFTEQAQEALNASQMLVRQYNHSQWDVEHVLMALLEQQSGLVGDIVKELGANIEAIKTEVAAGLERTPKMTDAAQQLNGDPDYSLLFLHSGNEFIKCLQ